MSQTDTASDDPLRTFDWAASGSPSHAVVMAVADEEATDPADIDPLYAAIDPDALDALFQPSSGTRPLDGTVQFEYLGYSVLLKAHGRGYLYERVGEAAVEADGRQQNTTADDD